MRSLSPLHHLSRSQVVHIVRQFEIRGQRTAELFRGLGKGEAGGGRRCDRDRGIQTTGLSPSVFISGTLLAAAAAASARVASFQSARAASRASVAAVAASVMGILGALYEL